MTDQGFHRVGPAEDLWEGEIRGVTVAGRKILLVKIDGTAHAYEDRCLHKAVELSKGKLSGRTLTCSAHEWTYDVCSGHGINPSGGALHRYPLKIEQNELWVKIDDQ